MPEILQYVLIGLAVAALLGVVLEEITHINKAKVTLFFGTLAWILLFVFSPAGAEREQVLTSLNENIAEIAGLWIFLVAAMTFVAYLNKKGMIENLIYLVLPKRISERALLFLTAAFCFVFSSLADNITATLVSITLILSLKLSAEKTIKYAALVVFAVNSGGVALITGDVTTLMIFRHRHRADFSGHHPVHHRRQLLLPDPSGADLPHGTLGHVSGGALLQ